jgi:hypothetical protein
MSHSNLRLRLGLTEDKSKSHYVRRSVDQSVSVSRPIWGRRPNFCYCQIFAGLMWGVLFEERTGLSFTIASGPRQRSHSQICLMRGSWPYFTVSYSRLPQPGGPDPRIYIPQEQGGPVILPGTVFHFRRLLRLAGPRYSNPPPYACLKTVLI